MATTAVPATAAAFRVYDDDTERGAGVVEHYTQMRSHQSLAFSRAMVARWGGGFGARAGGRMTVRAALAALDSFVDRSDPDTALPNSVHALQAAEGARAAGKPDWMVFCALVHDVGKLMYLWGTPAEGQGGRADDPQWALGGDTFVVGAPLPDCAVLPRLNALSPDARDAAIHARPTGIYEPGVGIMNVDFAFGHDEYAYLWALHNKIPLPREGLACLRLHSLYPWHSGGAYADLEEAGDEVLKAAVREFNVFDLYT